jgi:cell wall-associated NlpC family hydrolase
MRDLIGVPFVDGGRDASGMDCYGLARETMRRFGYDVPEISVSCFDTLSIHAIYEDQRARWEWRRVETPEPGDLMVMRLDPECPGQVSHVGVYIGNGRVIQTLKKRESHLIRIDDPYWSRKAGEWYRWAG